MTNQMPTNADNREVHKKQEFESYVMWKALPSILRGQPRQVLEKFSIDDEVAIDLLSIKTQKEFASRFNIKDPSTLSDWNKKIEKEGLMARINSWARKNTPNVILALYKAITRDAKAADVKAWMEIIENM